MDCISLSYCGQNPKNVISMGILSQSDEPTVVLLEMNATPVMVRFSAATHLVKPSRLPSFMISGVKNLRRLVGTPFRISRLNGTSSKEPLTARTQRKCFETFALQPCVQADGKQHVCRFRLAIGDKRTIARSITVEIWVVEDIGEHIAIARYVDNSGIRACRKQFRHDKFGKQEMGNMVRRQLSFDTVLGLCIRACHYASMVDQDIDPRDLSVVQDLISNLPYAG